MILTDLLYQTWKNDSNQRGYLGASVVGVPCDRRLWYGFRWIAKPEFPGRMLRLFNRGHREEEVFINELRQVCKGRVLDVNEDGKQFGFKEFGGHFACHLDGVAFGVPIDELGEEQPVLLEFKTLSDSSFKDLERNGLIESKPQYYAQVQVCMALAELDVCLFLAVNKNNDQIYYEVIEHDVEASNYYLERAQRTIYSAVPFDKIGGPAFYQCKMCPFYQHCHNGIVPEMNCRTCCHSTPMGDGTWRCEKHDKALSHDEQARGCGEHIFIPDLIDATVTRACEEFIVYRDRNGGLFANGAYTPQSDSDEIIIVDSSLMESRHVDTICDSRVRAATAMAD